MMQHGDATEMVVTGPWTAEAAAVVQAGEVERLVLNYALGFDEPSLDCLEGLPIRELDILDRRLSSLEPLYSLAPTLRALSVTTHPQLQLDLRRFPNLQWLSADWPQVNASIDAAARLQVAYLRSYGAADLMPLAALSGLEELVMKDRPKLKSLSGLSGLPKLRVLGIYLATGLADIDELSGRAEITDLALQNCRKIERLDVLARCVGICDLNLSECGDLASLDPLRSLSKLEDLQIYGSTRIVDSDLSPIAELPNLRLLRMRSRPSYRPSVEQIQASLPRH